MYAFSSAAIFSPGHPYIESTTVLSDNSNIIYSTFTGNIQFTVPCSLVAWAMMVGDTRAMLRAVDERLLRAVGELTTCESVWDGRMTCSGGEEFSHIE